MPATDALPSPAAAAPVVDARLARQLVLLNGAVPLVLLGWDAARGQLGVNGVNFAIRTTGMLGLVFLMLALVITPLRRLTGWSVLVAARRRIGVYAFVYLATHFTIFFALDRAGSVGSTIHEVLTRRYLQIGTVGLCLLVPLAVTSTDAMVARLGARRWKRLHRLTYVAAVAGVLHYALLVKSDLRQPLAFAAVLTALLGYRVVRSALDRRAKPAKPAKPAPAVKARSGFWSGELRVAGVVEETPDVRTFRLVALDGGALPFEARPGQYLNLALTIDGKKVRRSYTIASSPTCREHCEITVKRAADGYASHHLHDAVREGDRLRVSAPAGRFVFTGDEASRVLLLAGGVGVTPLMSMVRYLTERAWGGEIHLVFSVKQAADVIFREELDRLAKRFPRLHVTVTLTREPEGSDWAGERGPITAELLRRVVGAKFEGPVYLCGPDAMMAAMRGVLAEVGVREGDVHTEAFISPPSSATNEAESAHEDTAPAAAGGLVNIRFATSKRAAEVSRATTVLEAAESAGVDIPFECRSGICGQCRTRLVAGEVSMEAEDALTPDDRAKGMILACQAHAKGDVVVEA